MAKEKKVVELEEKELDNVVVVNGKEYEIKFLTYSLIMLDEKHGIKLQDLEDEEVASDIKTIVALIWAGIVHNADAPSFEDVAKSIELSELQEVAEKVTNEINKSVKKD